MSAPLSFVTAAVTGAGRGLGLQFTRHLLEETATALVVATCRFPEPNTPTPELAALQSAHPDRLLVLPLEVTDDGSIAAFVAAVTARLVAQFGAEHPGLRLLINNAGIMSRQSTAEVTRAELQHLFDVNSTSPVILTNAVRPLLVAAAARPVQAGEFPHTLVVNLSSILGSCATCTYATMCAYRASKCALNMLSQCLAVDLRPSKVGVLALHPGWVKTDMGGPSGHLTTDESITQIMKVIAEWTPETHIDPATGHALGYFTYDGSRMPF